MDAHDIEASPVFDGSDISMGGNGVAVPHGDGNLGISLPGTPSSVLIVPAGTGGGCVTTGPFANTTVAFGQVSSDLTADLLNNPQNLDYKPHCLRRDLTPRLAEPALNPDKVRAILNSPNITVFQKLLNAGDTPGIPGLHRSGHLSIGGEASDFFSSPGDPVFYLHHAQIDRLWTLWQQLDPKARQYALDGTGTVLNYPPSPVFQLNDTINLGKLSPKGPRPIREFMSTRGEKFSGVLSIGRSSISHPATVTVVNHHTISRHPMLEHKIAVNPQKNDLKPSLSGKTALGFKKPCHMFCQ